MTTLNLVNRKQFVWSATIHDERGTITETQVAAYWDPTKINSIEVAEAAAAMASASSGRKHFGVKAELNG